MQEATEYVNRFNVKTLHSCKNLGFIYCNQYFYNLLFMQVKLE